MYKNPRYNPLDNKNLEQLKLIKPEHAEQKGDFLRTNFLNTGEIHIKIYI